MTQATGLTVAEGLQRRRDNFLLLRIVAALLVIYGHSFVLSPQHGLKDIFSSSGWHTHSGTIAVDIFFVVSGFMVSGSYMRRAGLFQFMKARVLRIVPGLLVCLLISALVLGPLLTSWSLHDYFGSPKVGDYITQNLKFSSTMAWHLPGVFQNSAYSPAVNGSLWTLPAEFRMYVFVAVIGALGLLRLRACLVALLAALVLAGLFAPGYLPIHPMWIRLAGYFVLGIGVQLFKERISVRHEAMVALAFAAYLCRGADLYPYVFALALAYFCFWFAYALKLPSLEAGGDPSYGAYLWGWPLQQIFAQVFPGASSYANALICGAGALVLGYASWHLVERQALHLKSFSLLPRWHAIVARLQRRTDTPP